MSSDEIEGKPMLLIEIIDDPGDKNMPYKLKLNKEVAAKLSESSSQRFVKKYKIRLLQSHSVDHIDLENLFWQTRCSNE